jgi:hypothetical protein
MLLTFGSIALAAISNPVVIRLRLAAAAGRFKPL